MIDGDAALRYAADKNSPEYFDNCAASENDARRAMEMGGAVNFHTYKGWFKDTLPEFATAQTRRIGILRLDGDWYESTMTCLELLMPRVYPGGIVILDDYKAWDGCAKAVHDYLSTNKLAHRIREFANAVVYIETR